MHEKGIHLKWIKDNLQLEYLNYNAVSCKDCCKHWIENVMEWIVPWNYCPNDSKGMKFHSCFFVKCCPPTWSANWNRLRDQRRNEFNHPEIYVLSFSIKILSQSNVTRDIGTISFPQWQVACPRKEMTRCMSHYADQRKEIRNSLLWRKGIQIVK